MREAAETLAVSGWQGGRSAVRRSCRCRPVACSATVDLVVSDPTRPTQSFPADWPEGCPPVEAQPCSGDYYRIVGSELAAASDFRSHRELGKLPKAPPCLRAGLSTFRTLDDAERMALLFPVLGGFVALGALTDAYGVSLLTPGRQPSHTTVWPFEETNRTTPFEKVSSVRRGS